MYWLIMQPMWMYLAHSLNRLKLNRLLIQNHRRMQQLLIVFLLLFHRYLWILIIPTQILMNLKMLNQVSLHLFLVNNYLTLIRWLYHQCERHQVQVYKVLLRRDKRRMKMETILHSIMIQCIAWIDRDRLWK